MVHFGNASGQGEPFKGLQSGHILHPGIGHFREGQVERAEGLHRAERGGDLCTVIVSFIFFAAVVAILLSAKGVAEFRHPGAWSFP
jgi:hypothetical protein